MYLHDPFPLDHTGLAHHYTQCLAPFLALAPADSPILVPSIPDLCHCSAPAPGRSPISAGVFSPLTTGSSLPDCLESFCRGKYDFPLRRKKVGGLIVCVPLAPSTPAPLYHKPQAQACSIACTDLTRRLCLLYQLNPASPPLSGHPLDLERTRFPPGQASSTPH